MISVRVLPSLSFKFSFHASLAVVYYRKQWCWCRPKREAPMSLTSAIRDLRWSSSASGCKVGNEISPINRQKSASPWDNWDDSWAKNINLKKESNKLSLMWPRGAGDIWRQCKSSKIQVGQRADMRREERRTLTLNNVARSMQDGGVVQPSDWRKFSSKRQESWCRKHLNEQDYQGNHSW